MIRVDVLRNESSENRNGEHAQAWRNGRNKAGYLRSAAGSAKEARDSKIQAIYPLKGKPLNTLTKEIEDIIKNQEIKDILAILGCGVGEKFNLKNLRYDKIILLSDADVK